MTTYGKNMNDVEKYIKKQIKGFMDQSSNQMDEIIQEYINNWYEQNSDLVISTYYNELYTSVNNSFTKDIVSTGNGYQLIINCSFNDEFNQSFKNIFLTDEPDFNDICKWFCDGLISYFNNKGLKVTRK